uniref:Uncharacterized protein n=1 Tax=Arundo donax TaxID=35708 RepID=A0A0A9DUZ5_ARUDO
MSCSGAWVLIYKMFWLSQILPHMPILHHHGVEDAALTSQGIQGTQCHYLPKLYSRQ